MKKIITLVLALVSFTSFSMTSSCPAALPTTAPDFCSSFVTAATCYCANNLPKKMCSNINQVYDRMIALFGTIERACKFQTETSTQTCIDDWHCYLKGGQDSQGGLCSGVGKACV